jgi:gamma-glutamyltranspeptidase
MMLRDGKPWLALGSPGISSKAVAIALINLLGFKKDLYASVDAPRFDGNQPTQNFQVEARVPDHVRAGLAAFGIRVQPTAPYSWHPGVRARGHAGRENRRPHRRGRSAAGGIRRRVLTGNVDFIETETSFNLPRSVASLRGTDGICTP